MKPNKLHLGILREMVVEGGSRSSGKHNPTMHELRKLGFVSFDKATGEGFGENYRPTWLITDAGRSAVTLQDRGTS